jgi:hypothetical protein
MVSQLDNLYLSVYYADDEKTVIPNDKATINTAYHSVASMEMLLLAPISELGKRHHEKEDDIL